MKWNEMKLNPSTSVRQFRWNEWTQSNCSRYIVVCSMSVEIKKNCGSREARNSSKHWKKVHAIFPRENKFYLTTLHQTRKKKRFKHFHYSSQNIREKFNYCHTTSMHPGVRKRERGRMNGIKSCHSTKLKMIVVCVVSTLLKIQCRCHSNVLNSLQAIRNRTIFLFYDLHSLFASKHCRFKREKQIWHLTNGEHRTVGTLVTWLCELVDTYKISKWESN